MPVAANILILAAGASSRMRGADKLMEEIDGTPQLRRIALSAVATGAPVFVALPPESPARSAALGELRLTPLTVADAAQGMGRSLAAGARAAGRGAPLMVVPADMVLIGTRELQLMLGAAHAGPDRIWRGMDEAGRPGHPVVFPPRLIERLEALKGDEGARSVLAGEQPVLVRLPGLAATLDLDTPEDWAAFRAGLSPEGDSR